MEFYGRATCASNIVSPTSGANSLFPLASVTKPLMLLLLARPACLILPLRSVNVNQVAACMIERIAADAKTKTRDLWLDSDRISFMEVEFKRPMVVPLSLRVETADVASKTLFERDRQGP